MNSSARRRRNSSVSSTTHDRSDEGACGKLWDVYLKEAQSYDDALVKSWKDDMDSILVFPGLYSAILTAFVIESYQKLQPNPADNSVTLLKRISEQLGQQSNGTNFTPVPDATKFVPTSAALIYNVLWFNSLALALTCSFLATLVQQLSRKFLQSTAAVRSPTQRARLLQFLYFGIKEFNVNAIVNLIPALLHLSLFFFLVGLATFLGEVNHLLKWIFVALTCIVILGYSTLSILPIIWLSSPYFTPLSPLLWRIWTIIQNSYRHLCDFAGRIPKDGLRKSLSQLKQGWFWIDQVSRTSAERRYTRFNEIIRRSKDRNKLYEAKSISWTLRSLTDDSEMLPFIEALPDVLLKGESSPRTDNFHLIKPLLETRDPEIEIFSRIERVLENIDHPWHYKHRDRCRFACVQALYALGVTLLHFDHAEALVGRRADRIYRQLRGLAPFKLGTYEVASAASVLALYRFKEIRDISKILHDLPADHPTKQNQLNRLATITDNNTVPRRRQAVVSTQAAECELNEAASEALFIYLHDALQNYPPEFAFIITQFQFFLSKAGRHRLNENVQKIYLPIIVVTLSVKLAASIKNSASEDISLWITPLENIFSIVRCYLTDANLSRIIDHCSKNTHWKAVRTQYELLGKMVLHEQRKVLLSQPLEYPDALEYKSAPENEFIAHFLHQLIPLPPADPDEVFTLQGSALA